ncbi:peptidoglycan-binding domain-containing protein [Paracoccus mutanolyticus]|nr:peptidoglycan-binding domain-containing protein [Paracoccus mutanolyticus]
MARGFDTGGADGKLGAKSVEAVKGFQRSRGMVPDGYADANLLALLRG